MESHQHQLSCRVERIAFDEEHVVAAWRPGWKVRRLRPKCQLATIGPVDSHYVDLADTGRCAGKDNVAAIGRGIWSHEGARLVDRGNSPRLGVAIDIPFEQAVIPLARGVEDQARGHRHEPRLIAVQPPGRELLIGLAEPAYEQMG